MKRSLPSLHPPAIGSSQVFECFFVQLQFLCFGRRLALFCFLDVGHTYLSLLMSLFTVKKSMLQKGRTNQVRDCLQAKGAPLSRARTATDKVGRENRRAPTHAHAAQREAADWPAYGSG